MPIIPNTNNNYRVYLAGRGLLGLATVTLPNIQNMMDDLKGSGIFGTMSLPVAAHVQAMVMTLNWHVFIADVAVLFAQEKLQLDMYAAIQLQDTGRQKVKFQQWQITTRGMPSGMNLGTLDVGVKGSPASDWAIEYIKAWYNKAEVFEIDPLNAIYTINGVDYGADIRTAIGMT